MATIQELEALIRAHADNDHDKFRSVALCIAANAAAKSPVFAHKIQQLVNRETMKMIQLPHGMDAHLHATESRIKLSDMVLADKVRDRIERVLTEHRETDRLAEHGLKPMRKLLFEGPPGTGKTMMASALANELGLPILKVQLHSTISSHLGETAAHLAKIFGNIRLFRGVYMFDEFDALAGSRGGKEQDVGEMRRVVNSLLGFIEQDESHSLIIAATNHHSMLDKAMFRRFDDVIEFPLPSGDVAEQLIRSRLIWPVGIDWELVRTAADGIGHHDLVSACLRVSKDALLGSRERIDTTELVAAIRSRAPYYDGVPS